MTTYLCNAFSIQMLSSETEIPRLWNVWFQEETAGEAARRLTGGFVSAIGHADTARLVAAELGVEVPVNRASIQLGYGDRLVVAQYSGPRLPEGATSLPPGASFRWFSIELVV